MTTAVPYKQIYLEIQINRKSCVINSEVLWSEYKRMIPSTVDIICGHGGSVLHPNCYRKWRTGTPAAEWQEREAAFQRPRGTDDKNVWSL
jgi:hypothetical protein